MVYWSKYMYNDASENRKTKDGFANVWVSYLRKRTNKLANFPYPKNVDLLESMGALRRFSSTPSHVFTFSVGFWLSQLFAFSIKELGKDRERGKQDIDHSTMTTMCSMLISRCEGEKQNCDLNKCFKKRWLLSYSCLIAVIMNIETGDSNDLP